MPIKLYDKKEEVPEAQRATAIETKDGKFAVEEPLGDAGKKALDEERQARKDAEEKLKAEKKRADDLQRTADAKAKGISEDELQRIRDEEAKNRKPIEEERDKLSAENRKLKLDDRVRALGVKYGWMSDRVEMAMKDLNGRVDLTEDGKGIVVKDKSGNVTTETIDSFLEKTYKTEAPFLYAGSGGSGSGSDGSAGGGGSADAGAEKARADGKAAAKQQKEGREASSIAFK